MDEIWDVLEDFRKLGFDSNLGYIMLENPQGIWFWDPLTNTFNFLPKNGKSPTITRPYMPTFKDIPEDRLLIRAVRLEERRLLDKKKEGIK